MHASRYPVWLFDLDNTLHNASRHAFPVIDAAMNRYMEQMLGVDADTATTLRTGYWHRYGATLLGLLRHYPHAIKAHDFLAASHPLAELTAQYHPMPGLRRTLARLPGRKILFTNGARRYAEAMVKGLGIEREFAGIHAIEHGRFSPKPQPAAFRHILRRYHLQPAQCILVEDSLDNLRMARRLGMKTVWLRPHRRGHASVDVLLRRLDALPQHWRQLAGAVGL
ncbi:pyrimidine 5'-nucleotidase [Silvimonas iriomotensis]|uniref:Pyrimidine 5'-nucleotidase n=1 Tax=Silvimonas iriomotensis TaxID=449662 RepID=A0ABQ2PB24_9NEIS|nr:pyrimidine 5'-nucleotidase [Silvimonas iriomotensis]GGP22595.1 pyrimidine 5'-nucleotidase [Silvimonas iriomotensis]